MIRKLPARWHNCCTKSDSFVHRQITALDKPTWGSVHIHLHIPLVLEFVNETGKSRLCSFFVFIHHDVRNAESFFVFTFRKLRLQFYFGYPCNRTSHPYLSHDITSTRMQFQGICFQNTSSHDDDQLYCSKDYYRQKHWNTLPVTMITEIMNCNRLLWWLPWH